MRAWSDEPAISDIWNRFDVCLDAFDRLVNSPTAALETTEARRRLKDLGEKLGDLADELTIRAIRRGVVTARELYDLRERFDGKI